MKINEIISEGWKGAVVGGALGGAIGGLPGAAMGAYAGHAVQQGYHKSKLHPPANTVQSAFLTGHLFADVDRRVFNYLSQLEEEPDARKIARIGKFYDEMGEMIPNPGTTIEEANKKLYGLYDDLVQDLNSIR